MVLKRALLHRILSLFTSFFCLLIEDSLLALGDPIKIQSIEIIEPLKESNLRSIIKLTVSGKKIQLDEIRNLEKATSYQQDSNFDRHIFDRDHRVVYTRFDNIDGQYPFDYVVHDYSGINTLTVLAHIIDNNFKDATRKKVLHGLDEPLQRKNNLEAYILEKMQYLETLQAQAIRLPPVFWKQIYRPLLEFVDEEIDRYEEKDSKSKLEQEYLILMCSFLQNLQTYNPYQETGYAQNLAAYFSYLKGQKDDLKREKAELLLGVKQEMKQIRSDFVVAPVLNEDYPMTVGEIIPYKSILNRFFAYASATKTNYRKNIETILNWLTQFEKNNKVYIDLIQNSVIPEAEGQIAQVISEVEKYLIQNRKLFHSFEDQEKEHEIRYIIALMARVFPLFKEHFDVYYKHVLEYAIKNGHDRALENVKKIILELEKALVISEEKGLSHLESLNFDHILQMEGLFANYLAAFALPARDEHDGSLSMNNLMVYKSIDPYWHIDLIEN